MKIKYSILDFTPKDINEENHSLRAVFSTGDVDRHGEVVDQKSWILADFMQNPVVLFGHDHAQPPVGKIVGLSYNAEGNLEGEVQFAAKEYPFANVIWNLYKGGFMKAFSVGFSAGNVDIVNDQVILRNNTLYEISTVSVPANAMALAKSKGIDTAPLEEKIVEMEEEHAADCKTKSLIAKDCPCNKKPADGAPTEEVKAEAVPSEAAVAEEEKAEIPEVPTEEVTLAKGMEELVTSLKEGKVLSKKNRTAIEEALKALQAVLEADKKEEIQEDKSVNKLDSLKTISVNKTDRLSIKVETPAVRMTIPAHGRGKATLINKAIRRLIAEKAKK